MALLLTNDHLGPLIRAADFITELDRAYRDLAAGSGVCAPRIDVQSGQRASGNYQLGLAAGMSGRYAALRIKSDMVLREIVEGRQRKSKFCVRPGTYMGLVMLFDACNGGLLAILHDGLLQKMRVAADSALGVRYLAREDASTLGLLGSGGMAQAHVAAIASVRPLERVRLFSPTRANRERFAAEMREAHGIAVEAMEAPEEVYRGASLVASCASAIGPVLEGRHIEPGTHLTCIGGTLDAEANARVDVALRFGLAPSPSELPSLGFEAECLSFAEGNDRAAHGGTAQYANVPPDRRIAFADLLADRAKGRTNPSQVTFSERGNIHGVQFAAVAGMLFERAREAGLGDTLPDSLFLQSIRN